MLVTIAAPAVGAPPVNSPLVIVGGDRAYPPYEFIDKNGQPAGYNVDLTRAIAAVMGMRVEFRLGSWAEMRTALEDGTVDVLPGMSYSEERAHEVDFTPPHTIVNHAIFARRNSPPVQSLTDLKGKEVVVHRGGIMHDYLARQGGLKRLVLTDTPAEALRQLAAGRHDYAVVAILPGTYLIRELKLTNLVPVARSVAHHRYCYAVAKGNSELLAHFSEGLAILKKTGQYDDIYGKWLGVMEPAEVSWKALAKFGVALVSPLLLVLGVTMLWSRSLKIQVAQRTESLANALAELQLNQQQLVQADKLAALGTLVSGVAHEINNPNGLILLNIPILKKAHQDTAPILEEHYREYGDFTLGGISYCRMRSEIPRLLDEMHEGAQRIKRIVNDLKDFARRDDAAGTERVDLNLVVQTAVRLVEPSIRTATGNFTADYDNGLPLVMINSQRIEQVIINLLLNACQALPDRDHAIRLATRHQPAVGTVTVTVEDEGVGIPDSHLSRLTDPFFTTKRDQGGTGLGLSVSAGIVKEHGGTLGFASTPGSGTTVTLTLPVATEEQPR
ncbi:MAG TPA: transporter substrate-binding domain-containing protein [Geobacteraceae bacterium]